jgi:hypothetical protein
LTTAPTKYVVQRKRANGEWVNIAGRGFEHESHAMQLHVCRQFAVVERWGRKAMSSYRVVEVEGRGRRSALRVVPDDGVGGAGVYLPPAA